MSKRLQVLLGDEEFGVLRATARRHGMTVSAWIRQLIRGARGRGLTFRTSSSVAAPDGALMRNPPPSEVRRVTLVVQPSGSIARNQPTTSSRRARRGMMPEYLLLSRSVICLLQTTQGSTHDDGHDKLPGDGHEAARWRT